MPNRIICGGPQRPYTWSPPTGECHEFTRRFMTSRLGEERVSLALQHYPREPLTWESALVKAEVGFEAFPDLPCPMVNLNELTSIGLAMTHDLTETHYSQSSLDEVLASKAEGGLSTDKSVGYWMRFMSSKRLKQRILAHGPLKKSNAVFIDWLRHSLEEYVVWLRTANLPRLQLVEELYADERNWSFYACRAACGSSLRLVTVVSPIVNALVAIPLLDYLRQKRQSRSMSYLGCDPFIQGPTMWAELFGCDYISEDDRSAMDMNQRFDSVIGTPFLRGICFFLPGDFFSRLSSRRLVCQGSKAASKQASKRASKQESKQASKASQPASKPARQSGSQPASKQAREPASKPSKQASQPASKQASKPARQPAQALYHCTTENIAAVAGRW